MSKTGRAIALAAVFAGPLGDLQRVAAQTDDSPAIDDTLAMLREAGEVVAASRRPQPVREAPSDVTVVTADEIRAFGYRTLGEVLAHCRGFFVTYDRNYTYIGSRGFSRSGDYNARVLVLLNGHRLNDNVYGAVLPGLDFPVDLDLVDRIEIARGPGSALYGSNAMFGVINVITRKPPDLDGYRGRVETGSFTTGGFALSFGTPADKPVDVLVSTTILASEGQDLYFPEFDDGVTNGMAGGDDGTTAGSAFATVRRGRFRGQAVWSEREKEVPTASFETVFDDGRERTEDGRALLQGVYERPIGISHRMSASLSYDRTWYRGEYPYDYPPVVVNQDEDLGEWITTTAQFDLDAGPVTRVTTGFEYEYHLRVHQTNFDPDGTTYLDDDHPFQAASVFAQLEQRIGTRVLVSFGGRYDYRSDFEDSLNPRLALVYLANARTTLKYLAGRAFRAPNAYERYYDLPGSQVSDPALEPETILTHELLWSQRIGEQVDATFSAYHYELNRWIAQSADPGSGVLLTSNEDDVRSNGLEAELRFRTGAGLTGFGSITYNDPETEDSGASIPGSPRVVGNLGFLVPVPRTGLQLAPALRFVGRQTSLAGDDVASYAICDLTLTNRRPWRGIAFSASIYNLFGRSFGDVVGAEFVQTTIPQDGRNFRVTAGWAF